MRLLTVSSSISVFTAFASAQILDISMDLGIGGSSTATTLSTRTYTNSTVVVSATSTSVVSSVTAPYANSSAPDATPTMSNGSPLVQSPLNTTGGVVDTVLNTTGIPSNEIISKTFLTPFCIEDAKYAATCDSIQNTVAVCIDAANTCSDATTRQLLRTIITLKPCDLAADGSFLKKVCESWTMESKRCDAKTVRGPCSINHVKYLLRAFRDFVNLPKTQLSFVKMAVLEARNEEKERVQDHVPEELDDDEVEE